MFEYLLPLLLIGGFMVLMHKFGMGCCGSHSHADDHKAGEHHDDDRQAGLLSASSEAQPNKASGCCGSNSHGADHEPEMHHREGQFAESPTALPAKTGNGQTPTRT